MKILAVLSMACELLAWLILPATFLMAYLPRVDVGLQTAQSHLAVLVVPVLLWLACRLAATQARDSLWTAHRWVAEIAASLLLPLLAIAYGLILLGLDSWGRVPTLPMLMVYLGQLGALLEALGISVGVALFGGLLTFMAAILLGHFSQRAFTAALAPRLAGMRLALPVLLFSLVASGSINALGFASAPRVDLREPAALVFFSDRIEGRLQNSISEESPSMRARDRKERESYVAGRLDDAPNIILIVGDALRADALHSLGNPRPVTPFIDASGGGRLVWRGVGHSVCAESLCGLMGIAKSRYPHELTRESVSLHDVLAAHGYRNSLIFGGDHTNFYGLAGMFGRIDEFRDGAGAQGYMNDDRLVIRYTQETPAFDGRPTFLHYHLMSTHGLGLKLDDFKRFAPALNHYNAIAMGQASDQSKPQLLRNFYDNGAAQFDWVVSELLGVLREKGYLDRAIVIITGDHGEMLWEHGQVAHANGVYEPALRVPVAIFSFGMDFDHAPSAAGCGPVSTVDIAPTLADLVGFTAPRGWSGLSLVAPESCERRSQRLVRFSQAMEVGAIGRFGSSQLKYWVALRSGREFLFDVAADPAESRNLLEGGGGMHQDAVRTLRAAVAGAAASAPVQGAETFVEVPESAGGAE